MTDAGGGGARASGRWRWLVFALLAGGIAARLVVLDADPYFTDWVGYVIDEGRWVETARNIALFRSVDLYDLARMHLALSPGFQVATLAVFETVGVHLWSARLVSALAGIGLLLLVAVGLRRAFHPAALAFGLAVLAFEHQFLFLSRVALPEIPSLLFAAAAFALVVAPGCTARRALLAGLCGAVAVAMKGTTLFVVPVFGILLALDPAADARTRVRNVAAYAAGLAGPMLGGLAGALGVGLLDTAGGGIVHTFLGFLAHAGPKQIVWRVHGGSFLLPTYVALLAAWTGSFRTFTRATLAESWTHRVYVGAAAWCAWWSLVWLPLQYLPERYVVHLQFPALLCGMAGLTLVLRAGSVGTAAPCSRGVLARSWAGAWLALPSAMLVAPLLAATVAPALGADPTSATAALAALALAGAALSLVAAAGLHRPEIVVSLQVFPLVGVAAWLALALASGRTPAFWPSSADRGSATLAAALAVALLAATAAGIARRRPSDRPRASAVAGASAALGVASCVAFATISLPHVLAPRYTMRSEAVRLAAELSGAREVFAGMASLLIPTGIRHRNQLLHDRRPDAAVLGVRAQAACCVPVPEPLRALVEVDRRVLDLRWTPPAASWRPAYFVVLRTPAGPLEHAQPIGPVIEFARPAPRSPARPTLR